MNLSLQKEIERITAQLIEKYKPERIILFDSAARGDATPDSDVDLLIHSKAPDRFSA